MVSAAPAGTAAPADPAGTAAPAAAERAGLAGAGVLAEVVRGDMVESVHGGHLVLTDPSGEPWLVVGDPRIPIWPRSSLKPLQAVGLLRAGLDVDDAGLALACASHSGTAAHLSGVRGVLTGAGLDESDLRNTPDLPLDPDAAARWRTAGRPPSSVAQNCSGKHAAMLATCVANGWDTVSYLDPDHPVQAAVRAAVEDLSGEAVGRVTVDGCGAPLLSTSVLGLARAFGRIASAGATAGRDGADPAQARVARAMGAHPALVGGPGRDITAFLEAVPGLVAKDGAEGVYAAGLPDGSAVAFKVLDGAARPRPVVLAAALVALLGRATAGGPSAVDGEAGEVVAAVRAVGSTPVLGHGRPVGEVRAVLGGRP